MVTKFEPKEEKFNRKTKEELNALKQEVEALNAKLASLSVEELEQVAGGSSINPHEIRLLLTFGLTSGLGLPSSSVLNDITKNCQNDSVTIR